jgi:hypothetical protein
MVLTPELDDAATTSWPFLTKPVDQICSDEVAASDDDDLHGNPPDAQRGIGAGSAIVACSRPLLQALRKARSSAFTWSWWVAVMPWGPWIVLLERALDQLRRLAPIPHRDDPVVLAVQHERRHVFGSSSNSDRRCREIDEARPSLTAALALRSRARDPGNGSAMRVKPDVASSEATQQANGPQLLASRHALPNTRLKIVSTCLV